MFVPFRRFPESRKRSGSLEEDHPDRKYTTFCGPLEFYLKGGGRHPLEMDRHAYTFEGKYGLKWVMQREMTAREITNMEKENLRIGAI